MSNTPRVDGAESCFGSFRFVSATFARQLERELAEANRKLEKGNQSITNIKTSMFYRNYCIGGDMERLMNQAIEALGGKQ